MEVQVKLHFHSSFPVIGTDESIQEKRRSNNEHNT